MNKNTGIIIGVLVILLIIVGIYSSKNIKNDELMMNNVENTKDKMMEDISNDAMMDEAVPSDESMMGEDKTKVMDNVEDDAMMTSGSYEVYAPDKLALAETGNVVLFFRANWCPTCRAVDNDIRTHLENIPKNLTILDVDYDNSTNLKKKYGVTYQHTFVQVDKDGNQIKKWTGSPTLASIVSEVK